MPDTVHTPDNAPSRRLRSSTAINESIPSSKNPTAAGGRSDNPSTARTSSCTNPTSTASRSAAGVRRSRDTNPPAGAAASRTRTAGSTSSRNDGAAPLSRPATTAQSTTATTAVAAPCSTRRSSAPRPCAGASHP